MLMENVCLAQKKLKLPVEFQMLLVRYNITFYRRFLSLIKTYFPNDNKKIKSQ